MEGDEIEVPQKSSIAYSDNVLRCHFGVDRSLTSWLTG